MSIPANLILYYDGAENYPLSFSTSRLFYPRYGTPPLHLRITSEKFYLTRASGYAGDYALKDFPLAGGIERKASLRELHSNVLGLAKERARFLRALDRFAKLSRPYLWVDMSWAEMYADDAYRPYEVYDLLLQYCQQRNISILGPSEAKTQKRRLMCGDFLVALLINAAFPQQGYIAADPQKIFAA